MGGVLIDVSRIKKVPNEKKKQNNKKKLIRPNHLDSILMSNDNNELFGWQWWFDFERRKKNPHENGEWNKNYVCEDWRPYLI